MVDLNEINKQTYNRIAHKYIEEAEADHEDKSKIDYFLTTFNGKKILDLGCGTGVVSKYLSNLSYDVTGLDFSEEMIKISKLLDPKSKFITGDVLEVDKIDDKFDGIIASHLLVHFSREQMIEILKKLKIIMNADSSLFIEFVPYLQEGLQPESLDNSCQLSRYCYNDTIVSELLNQTGYITTFNETVELPEYEVTTMIAKLSR